jgi:transposase-like protein
MVEHHGDGEKTAVGHESNVEDLRCPDCGSFNIEENDPRPGEHTCRDCGGWLDA